MAVLVRHDIELTYKLLKAMGRVLRYLSILLIHNSGVIKSEVNLGYL